MYLGPSLQPGWKFIGVGPNNYWRGAGWHPKLAIVLHVMQGSLATCDSWFRNPSNGVGSSNFGIGRNGEVHCYIDPDGPDAPYANGNLSHQDSQVTQLLQLAASANPNYPNNPNYYTVSIEHEGMEKNGNDFTMTPAQRSASAEVAAFYMNRYNIPFADQFMLGHYQFDSDTRRYCPGLSNSEWALWQSTVQSILTSIQIPPNPPVPPSPPDPCLDYLNSFHAIYNRSQTTLDLLVQVVDQLQNIQADANY